MTSFGKRLTWMVFLLVLLLGSWQGIRASTPGASKYSSPLAFSFEDTRSRVRLEGSSTVTDWTCESSTVKGFVTLPLREDLIPNIIRLIRIGERNALRRTVTRGLVARPRGLLWIPVDSFECDNRRMTQDMKQALKAREHPTIIFQYNRFHDIKFLSDGSETIPTMELELGGGLALAGAANAIDVRTQVRPRSPDRLQLEGQIDLLMTEYEITPPTALMGLVQVKDPVTVEYKIWADRIENAERARNYIQRKMEEYGGNSISDRGDTGTGNE